MTNTTDRAMLTPRQLRVHTYLLARMKRKHRDVEAARAAFQKNPNYYNAVTLQLAQRAARPVLRVVAGY